MHVRAYLDLADRTSAYKTQSCRVTTENMVVPAFRKYNFCLLPFVVNAMPEPPLACLQSLTPKTVTDQHDAHFAAKTAIWNISIDDIAHLLSVPMCDIRYPRLILILDNKYPQNCSRFRRQYRLLSLLQVHQPIPYSLQGTSPVQINPIPRHHPHYHATTTARSHAVLAASATAAATGCSSPECGATVSQANSWSPMRLRKDGQLGSVDVYSLRYSKMKLRWGAPLWMKGNRRPFFS